MLIFAGKYLILIIIIDTPNSPVERCENILVDDIFNDYLWLSMNLNNG